MPQGMDSKFLVVGTHLPTWMASASNEVECKGSTVYNTPVILAQLGEHGVRDLPSMCNLPIQPANSSDTKACGLLSLSGYTLADNVHKSGHPFSVVAHPGMPRIVMCAMHR